MSLRTLPVYGPGMNILTLLGSPRKGGNSETMARWLCEPLAEAGHAIEFVHLDNLALKGCRACNLCKTKLDRCAVMDDLSEVLEKARAADLWVLATPVYYGDVPAQIKAFIDRTYSFLVPNYAKAEVRTRLNPGKRMAWAIAQGHPKEDLFGDIFPRYEYFFRHYHLFSDTRLLRACGVYDLGAAKKRHDVRDQALEMGRDLARPTGG